MDKNLRNTHVQFKSYFKTSSISYLNNIGGQVVPFTNNFNKKIVFITIAVRRFHLQFVVVIRPGTFWSELKKIAKTKAIQSQYKFIAFNQRKI